MGGKEEAKLAIGIEVVKASGGEMSHSIGRKGFS